MTNRKWTVRVTLLGRRDESSVPRVGESQSIGRFASWAEARRAAESWLDDPTFIWKAEAVQRRRNTTPTSRRGGEGE